ncbi:MAG: bifunctional folylpolyglutamate synthase/dihydrofolate synthase [Anaerolineae bacterium]
MRTYSQAIDYLAGFINYERRKLPAYSTETLNLDRVRDLLNRLGDPHRAYPTIHIAGTKGKGSTSAMIEAILRAAGYRTGLFTSPHLHTLRERMRVNGEPISRDGFAALVDAIEPHVAAVAGATWFEIITALGFLHFARSTIDVGVIEVGLGGRFDATNVLMPLVSVITSLSMDHMAWLGDTLEQIAFEKAGIITPGAPVVSAPQRATALAVIERVAAERGAPLSVVGRDVAFEFLSATLDGQEFKLSRGNSMGNSMGNSSDDFSRPSAPATDPTGALRRVATTFRIPLLGAHQITNAAVAVTAIRQAEGLSITDESLTRGLETVQWPGRFEIARRDPPLIFDAAHNADSAEKLAAALEAVFPGRRWTLVFGALSDKDITGMLDALLPRADPVIVTRAHHVRAANIEHIADLVAERQRSALIAPSVKDALERALATDAPVIVTGSLTVIGEAREAWSAHIGAPPPDRDE